MARIGPTAPAMGPERVPARSRDRWGASGGTSRWPAPSPGGSGRGFLARHLAGRRSGMTVAGHLGATDADVARRHDGRDRVLVDHLADRVAQQHDELVERLDGALQLDAVDEVDRDRDALAPQRIEERILQGLALGHVFLHLRPSLVVIAAKCATGGVPAGRSKPILRPVHTLASYCGAAQKSPRPPIG